MADKKKIMNILSKVYINKKEFSELLNSDYVVSADSIGIHYGGGGHPLFKVYLDYSR